MPTSDQAVTRWPVGMDLGMNHSQLVMPEATGDLIDDTPARW
jgi:hypothetical protein